jgi:tRNA(fMet)-specific endonuclease VapC
MILLDTDVCIEILRGNQSVIDQYQHVEERAAISFMTVGELFYGAEKSKFKESNRHVVEEFLLSIDVINSDIEILRKFGDLKANLSLNKVLLADADLFIASTALTKCSKLITGNGKHYNRIENLVIENWIPCLG